MAHEGEIFMYHPGGFRMIDVKSVRSLLLVLEPRPLQPKLGSSNSR